MNKALHKAQEQDLNNILTFVEKNIGSCPYIYIDISVYGLSNPNMDVWWAEYHDELAIIVMKYYDSFQIYAPENHWNRNEILDLIRQYSPQRITANDTVAKILEPMLKGEYACTYGAIFVQPLIEMEPKKEKYLYGCEAADVKDIPEIVQLLLQEPAFGSQYTETELTGQLIERYVTKMGRSMIIRREGKIVAHMGTFAETEKVAISSGAVILKEYRQLDFFTNLSRALFETICSIGGTNIYYFVTQKRHIKMYQHYGQQCAEYGKFNRKDK